MKDKELFEIAFIALDKLLDYQGECILPDETKEADELDTAICKVRYRMLKKEYHTAIKIAAPFVKEFFDNYVTLCSPAAKEKYDLIEKFSQ